MTLIPAAQAARHALYCALLGAVLGAGTVAVAARVTELDIDPRMETACTHPRNEGEMTVLVILEGRLVCWRWR